VFRTAPIVLFLMFSASLPCLPAQTPHRKHAVSEAATQLPKPLLDAEAAIAKSDWKTAATTLDVWLAAHPDDARALFDAGYVADAQNRLDDAVGFYKRSATAEPSSFETRLMLGILLARQGKLAEARPELIAATTLDPGEAGPALKARAWRALAQIDKPGPNDQGDAAQASQDLLEALKLSPETPEDTLLAAQLAESQGQMDAALAAYKRLLAADPKSSVAQAGLAHLLIARQQYPEAEALLRTALEQTPDDPALTAQLAAVLAAQDKAEALPLLKRLHMAHPEDAAITSMLAQVMTQAGDSAGADLLVVQLLTASPNDVDLLVAHGENLIRQLRYKEAFVAFDKATKADEANGEAWSGLAFAASKAGQPSIALHALTMRSKFLPEVPATYFLWATTYDTLHAKDEAISYYHQFLTAAAGKFPDQEWQAKQRLLLLEKKK
jgi:predicted Zn-dependent protease